MGTKDPTTERPVENGDKATPSTPTGNAANATPDVALKGADPTQQPFTIIKSTAMTVAECSEDTMRAVDEALDSAQARVDQVQAELEAQPTPTDQETLLNDKYKVSIEVVEETLEAIGQVSRIKAAGRLKCYRASFTGIGHAAIYRYNTGPAADEIRYLTNVRSPSIHQRVMHEAFHAVHANKYPTFSESLTSMRRDLAERLGAPDEYFTVEFKDEATADEYTAGYEDLYGLSRFFKVWTEYWAYRRYLEYSINLELEEFVYKRYDEDYLHRTVMLDAPISQYLENLKSDGLILPDGSQFDPQADPAL